jgi:hypothetical protein
VLVESSGGSLDLLPAASGGLDARLRFRRVRDDGA